jgi:Zn-dependent alcohol dehydrogenase
MGHEGVGLVREVGSGVTRVKVGDKVVMHWRRAAGIESEFPRYRFAERSEVSFQPSASDLSEKADRRSLIADSFTSGLVTTWAEQTICSENRLTPVPADTSDHLCVMLGCGLSTALATVESETRGFGESVLVIGCGGLGLNLLGALGLVSPSRVCVCDLHENKRRRAEILDAEFVNTAKGEKITGKFDLILDTAGSPETIANAFPRLAPSGRYVCIGQPKPGATVTLPNGRQLFDGEGQTIKATQGGGFRPHLDIPRYLKIADQLFVHNTITHTFALEQINAALDLVRAGEAGRVVIEMPRSNQPSAISHQLQAA